MLAWGGLTACLWARAVWSVGAAPLEAPAVRVQPLRIDLNQADVNQLQLLPGVGSVRAAGIVLDRIRHGPFRSVEELQRVDGFGPVVIEEIRPFIHCGARANGR
jgi:competence protein ComEA